MKSKKHRTILPELFRLSIVLTLGLLAPPVMADEEPTYVDCGSDCDATDPIDVNNYVRHTVNKDVDKWEPGDILIVTDGNGNTGTYTYSPMFGTFVPTGSVGGGGSSTNGTGSTGSGSGSGGSLDGGGSGWSDPATSDVTCLDFYGCTGGGSF